MSPAVYLGCTGKRPHPYDSESPRYQSTLGSYLAFRHFHHRSETNFVERG